MNEIYIYILKHPITQEVRYVGKTNNIKKRLHSHISEAKYRVHTKRYVLNWIRKLLNEDLLPIMEVIDIVDIEKWEEKEIYWIDFYKQKNCRLCNITKGGEGGKGGDNFSKEYKEFLSFKMKDYNSLYNDEHKLIIWNMIIKGSKLLEIKEIYPEFTRDQLYQVKSGRTWNHITNIKKVRPIRGLYSKLNKEVIEQIKTDYLSGVKIKEISVKYKISIGYSYRIVNNNYK